MQFELAKGHYTEAFVEVPVIERKIDATANDSDKTFTVPAGEMWKLNSMLITLVSTATVGNRQIVIEAKDPTGVMMGRMSAGAVQAASLTRYYSVMQGIYRESAFINGDIQVPMPVDTYLKPGSTLRVFDSGAVDAAADDMTVAYSYKKFIGPF